MSKRQQYIVMKSASIRTQVYNNGNVLESSHHSVHRIIPVNERRHFGFADYDLAEKGRTLIAGP